MGRKIAILGAGSWGITLGKLLYDNGHDVRVWCYLDDELDMLNKYRERIDILPGIRLAEDVLISTDMEAVVGGAELVFFVIPSFGVRNVAREAAPYLSPGAVAVSAAKGFEENTYLRMTEVMQEELADASGYVAFSGPSHAEEVSRRIPTAIVAAANDVQSARVVQKAAMCDFLRIYTNTDVVGVEVGAALKNVIAIASGAVDGLGYGDNTKGALLTRGLAEIRRLGNAFGANPETFGGLSGLGDLITTCISKHSRNRYVGEGLGRGERLEDILARMKMVAEGVKTTKNAYELSQKYSVEMPITEQMYFVLFEGKDAEQAVNDLMTRDPKHED